MKYELMTVVIEKASPTQLGRYDRRSIVRGVEALISHLEEEQKGNLLSVRCVWKPIVPKDVSVAPSFVYYPLSMAIHVNPRLAS